VEGLAGLAARSASASLRPGRRWPAPWPFSG
jgi:hypothetical protein